MLRPLIALDVRSLPRFEVRASARPGE